MIPNTPKEVQNNLPASFETKRFNVIVSDKTFSVLFDTLYQDKITSVQRELYSNAIDSHIAANCIDVPIYVQLPTSLEPTFVVRDYGTSLSHDDVMGVYSDVFGTTKDKTNEQVGYLGLGSKSPYSYTDSFTVKAYMDGEVRTYLAALDNDRIPTVTALGSKPTSEPTGLEVSFPVRKQDVEDFRKKAAKVCLPLPTKPKFNVGVTVEIPEPILTLKSGEVKMFENQIGYYARQQGHNMAKISIKQGWVIYPVSESEVPSSTWIPNNKAILIEVPIGTVEVAASRESLSLNDATKKVINKVVEEAGQVVLTHIEKEIAASKNYYDACAKYFSTLTGYITDQNKNLVPRYNGKVLKQMIPLEPFAEGKWRTNKNMKWPEAKVGWNQSQASINSVQVPNMTFYYKLKDEKVPRMLMRLNDYASNNAILMCDITQDELDKIKKDFALPDSSFKNVSTLQDNPPVAKVKGQKQGTTNKPYKADGLWTREELPSNGDYMWLPITQKAGKIAFPFGNQKEFNLRLFTDNILEPLKKVSTAIEEHGGPGFEGLDRISAYMNGNGPFSPVQSNLFLMIKSVESRLDPPQDKRFDVAVKKYLKDNLKYVNSMKIKTTLEQDSLFTIDAAVLGFKTLKPTTAKPSRIAWWQLENFFTGMDITRDVDSQIKEIKLKYPLLFSRHNEKAIKKYIELINKEKVNV